MKKLNYLLLFFQFFILNSYSQSKDGYLVVNFEGDVYSLLNNSNSKRIQVGDILNENTNLRINLRSFVTIFDSRRNQYIVLNGDRIIKIKDVFIKNAFQKPKELPDFLSRIFSDFSQIFSTEDQSKKKYREGEVAPKFTAICPKKCLVLNDSIIFRWSKISTDMKYRFVLYDENFKLLKDTIVANSFLLLHEPGLFIRGHEYIWQILANRSVEKFKELSIFKFVDDSSKIDMDLKFSTLKEVLNSGENQKSYILKGLLYENYQYYSEALECYLNEIKRNGSSRESEQLVINVLEKIKVKISLNELLNNI
jgi:hypothetical protein